MKKLHPNEATVREWVAISLWLGVTVS